MDKVLEFILSDECILTPNSDGDYYLQENLRTHHYGLFGSFSTKTHKEGDRFGISCNNETMQFITFKRDDKSFGIYGYLQTYEHISRGEPDDNGYYARSTQEEVIKYLQEQWI